MTLFELAFACFLYGHLTNYDNSYLEFMRRVDWRLDMHDAAHRRALLQWLRQWGCRQIHPDYLRPTSASLLRWYRDNHKRLPAFSRNIWELSDRQICSTAEAYEELRLIEASRRKSTGRKTHAITVGPTGAAKILFALRPNSLVPWDIPIRRALHHTQDGDSYALFLADLKETILELEEPARKAGFTLSDLPHRMGRPHSTVPKLIDEYYWATITRRWKKRSPKQLEKWVTPRS